MSHMISIFLFIIRLIFTTWLMLKAGDSSRLQNMGELRFEWIVKIENIAVLVLFK